jgi:hypothetical protein
MDKDEIYPAPFLRWRYLLNTDPDYAKFVARHVASNDRAFTTGVYNYEYDRKNAVALVLDRIMGGC